jgi:hypothetical protein
VTHVQQPAAHDCACSTRVQTTLIDSSKNEFLDHRKGLRVFLM